MSIFDDIARLPIICQAADASKVETKIREALSSQMEGTNHAPISHAALAKHFAEDAMASWQRYVLSLEVCRSFINAMGHMSGLDLRDLMGGDYRPPACRMVVSVPNDIFIFSDIAEGEDALIVTYCHQGSLHVLNSHEEMIDQCFMLIAMFCTAMMIPKMTVVDPVRHHEKLLRARAKRKAAPLLSYNTVKIPIVRQGRRAAEKLLEGAGPKKALHHVQAFVRFVADDTSPIGRRGVFVRDHWRGSPALGIRITERHPQ